LGASAEGDGRFGYLPARREQTVTRPATIRVVLADDSALIREGLASMLAGRGDVELVGAGRDGEELEELISTERPDVVVTDLRMPPSGGREGIRIASRLRSSDPHIGVVVLSQYVDPDFATELMWEGSSGRAYLLKDRLADAPELVRAIEAVSEGRSVVDPAVVDALIEVQQRKQSSPLAELTDREREVLSLIAEGQSNAAIAASLVLTKRAVEKHVNSIFAKLELTEAENVSRRVKATLMFLADEDGAAPA
jgi:DNA-binding NarL/FixJ family response regulator